MSDDQIKFFCEHCGQKIAVARGLAGAAVRCPGCGQAANVPSDRAKTAMVDTSSVSSPGPFGGSGPFKAGGPFGGAPEPAPGAAPPQPQATPPAPQAAPPQPYGSSPFGGPAPQPAPAQPFTPQPFAPAPAAQPQPFAQQPAQPQPFAQQPAQPQPFAQQPAQPQPFAIRQPQAYVPPQSFAPMQPMQGGYNQGYVPGAQQQNGLAIASLVLGLISAVVCCVGPITGLPAIITGVLALQRNQSRGMAITGLVAGSLGLVGGFIYWIATIAGQH